MLKRILTVLLSVLALAAVPALAPTASVASPSVVQVAPAPDVVESDFAEPSAAAPAGRAIYVQNSLYSTGSVKMCTGHNGGGTCYTVPRNSKSPVPVRSVYGQRFCLTMVNSSYVREGGYWNTGVLTFGPRAAVKICP